jgi:hypothetical protein
VSELILEDLHSLLRDWLRVAENFFIKRDRSIKSMLAYRIEALEAMKKKFQGKKQPNKNIMERIRPTKTEMGFKLFLRAAFTICCSSE